MMNVEVREGRGISELQIFPGGNETRAKWSSGHVHD